MIRRNALALGMLLIWGYVISINIVFRHAHRLPDGRVISHVHPYKAKGEKGPFSSNPHSQSELTWLDSYSNTPFFGLFVTEFEFTPPIVFQDPVNDVYNVTFRSCELTSQNPRGPPVHLV